MCPWEADAGHYYYTTETYRDNKGQHADAAGASRPLGAGIRRGQAFLRRRADARDARRDHALLKQVEPFPTNELVPYDTSYLSGFVVEHYQVVLLEAAQASEDAMQQKLEAMCAAQVPGDTYRNLVIHPTFSAARSSTSSCRSGC